MSKHKEKTLTGEDHIRAIGLMMKLLGETVWASKGNAEDDFERWLMQCRGLDITTDKDRMRLWFRSALKGAGICQ